MWPFDQNNQQMYQQYAQAYNTGNYTSIDPKQAIGHMQQFMRNAPPEMQNQVYQQYFQQLPFEQRQQFVQRMPTEYGMNPNDPNSMARGFQLAGQQQPGILSQLFSQFTGGNTGGGGMGSSLAQKGLGMLVGMVANHLLNNQGSGGILNGFEMSQQQQYVGGNQPYGNAPNQQYGFTGNPQSAYGPGGMGGEREGERRREREGER